MNLPNFNTIDSSELKIRRRYRDYTRFDEVVSEYLNGEGIPVNELLAYLGIKLDTLRAYGRDRGKEHKFKMSVIKHETTKKMYVLFYTKKNPNK